MRVHCILRLAYNLRFLSHSRIQPILPHNHQTFLAQARTMAQAQTDLPRQSPVDIRSSDVQYDAKLANNKFTFVYDEHEKLVLKYMGHTWRVCLPEDSHSIMRSSHLADEYHLVQFHAHWSTKPLDGSEHLIDGLRAEAELHFVYGNSKYASFEDCLQHRDGLCVIAVFLDERKEDNDELEPLTHDMEKIAGGHNVELKHLHIVNLIPAKSQFYSYEGSLTTPPYSECVQWVVMVDPVYISTRQLKKFYAVEKGCNARGVQPLNGRIIKSSFKMDDQNIN